MPSRASSHQARARTAGPMTLAVVAARAARRPSSSAAGRSGLLVLMALLYLGGIFVNPGFFGSADAFHALLRDAARYAVMAVGMTFVIVNKDLDLSVGSTYGLVAVVFSMAFAPSLLRPRPGAPRS